MSDDAIRKALEVAAQGLEGSAAASQWLAEPEELAAAPGAAIEEAFTDALIHGAGFLMVRADGRVERLDPASVQLRPLPPPPSAADEY